MAYNLYYLRYNNYFNRKTIPHRGHSWFTKYQIGAQAGVELFNFGDGIDTTQLVNTNLWANPDSTPNYLIVQSDTNLNDYTRWYVTHFDYIRQGQYRATLKRDALAENYDLIINAPMFIKKGTANDGDSAIFNTEGQAYNQIKSKETLLYDETKVPWIVGYIPRDSFPEAAKITQQIQPNYDLSYDTLEAFQEAFPFNKAQSNRKSINRYNSSPIYSVRAGSPTQTSVINISWTSNGLFSYNPWRVPNSLTPTWYEGVALGVSRSTLIKYFGNTYFKPFLIYSTLGKDVWNQVSGNVVKQMDQSLEAIYNPYNTTDFETLKNFLNGKTVRIGTASTTYSYYKINVDYDYKFFEQQMPASTYTIAASAMPFDMLVNNHTPENYIVTMDYSDYYYTLEEVKRVDIQATIPASTSRLSLDDSPYDMFAIPYGSLAVFHNGVGEFVTNKNYASIAQAIATSVGSNNIYDVQLLPYCPLRECIQEDGSFNYTDDMRNMTYILDDKEQAIGNIFWCRTSSFTFNIPLQISVQNYKIENETDMYRLCSPNYNGVFEFNLAKNGGLNYIEVDCTYKPFAPYIKLNPDFKRLYGNDFNDQRGLLCGGDFSVAQITSAWANYQMQNKNYQNIFDREIQSMELSKKASLIKGVSNLLPGAVSTLTGMENTGLGAVKAGSQIINNAANVVWDQVLKKDQINAKRELFNYNLQNIQALPQSLSKSSAFNINSKYVPFLEKYTCTEDEKNALIDKIKWQGMTIMRVGAIQDYVWADDTYIEALPLRLDNLLDDYHMAETISQELDQGTYIYLYNEEEDE